MMRLWTVFQVPYALTVACRASVVLLDSLDPPDPPPLVRKIQIAVGPNPLPSMSMEPADLAVGDVLEVEVENAPVPAVDIAIGNAVAKPDTTAGAAARYKITSDLSKRLDLRSGSNSIRLVNNEGAPVAERSFTLRPTIQRVSRQTEARSPVPRPGEPRNFTLTAVIVPRVAEGQTIGLSLTRVGNKGSESPVATSISRSKDGDILASFQGVLPGVYRVTVTVGGATSKLLPMPRSGLPVDAVQVS